MKSSDLGCGSKACDGVKSSEVAHGPVDNCIYKAGTASPADSTEFQFTKFYP